MYQPRPIVGQVIMMDGWEVRSYATIPSHLRMLSIFLRAQCNLIATCVLLAVILHYKPCHITLIKRCPIKKGDHIRPIYLSIAWSKFTQTLRIDTQHRFAENHLPRWVQKLDTFFLSHQPSEAQVRGWYFLTLEEYKIVPVSTLGIRYETPRVHTCWKSVQILFCIKHLQNTDLNWNYMWKCSVSSLDNNFYMILQKTNQQFQIEWDSKCAIQSLVIWGNTLVMLNEPS